MKTRLYSAALVLIAALGAQQAALGASQQHSTSRTFVSHNGNGASAMIRPKPLLKSPPVPVTFFSAAQLNANGTTSYEPLTADVNGDKLADVLTVVQNSASPTGMYLSVMLGAGSGSVDAPVLTPVNFGSNNFAIAADVNKDGKADVLLVHANSVDVLISNGDGSFSVLASFATGIASPVAASLWDVNHDGVMDLVVVGGTSNHASYLLGNGSGSFGSPQVTSFPAQVTAGVLADVDKDGNLDFVTNANLYPGDGHGGFSAAIAFQGLDGQNVGATTSDSIAVADVNGDGKPDVITANGNWNTVTVFLNQGSRRLTQTAVSQWTGNSPVAVAVADVNWDGKADLVVTSSAQSDLTVLLGNGDGTFLAPGFGYAIGGSPSARAVFADFYGDGNLDALVTDNVSSVVLARSFGDGTFQGASDSNIVVSAGASNSNGALSIATADFNGDGIPDFVVGQNSVLPGTGVIVFLGQSKGSLGKGNVYAAGAALSYVATGDINHDGKADIVASNWATGGIDVLIGNGSGTFQVPIPVLLPAITNGVVVGDFNGDGWPDVAALGKNSVVYILLNNGSGSLVPTWAYPLSGAGLELTAADLNNDGKLDLCVAMTSTSRVAILLGNGNGTFAGAPDYDTTLPSPYGIVAGDLNQDGIADLVVTSPASGNISVAFGNGDGTFQTPSTYPATSSPSQVNPAPGEVALSDVDEDGNMDIIFANSGYSDVGVLLGDGNGNFYGPSEFPAGGGSMAMVVSDLNRDSWPDVVTGDSHFSGVSVLYNTTAVQATGDFSISASPASVSISSGGSGTSTITLTSSNGFFGSVQLSCSNLPAALSCSFKPSSVHVSKNAPVTSLLTITSAQTESAVHTSNPSTGFALAILPIVGAMFFWRTPKAPRMMAVFALCASMMVFSGCQSLAPQGKGHNPQTYTITVNATGWNGTAHTSQVQVTVQQ